MSMINLQNGDCMEALREMDANQFDLAIVDPPYGIGISKNPVRQQHERKQWDSEIPDDEYFYQLRRVSQNQIIWGGNYFDLPPTQGFLIWDKVQPHDFSLSMCEFAWMSFQKPAKIFKRSVLAERNKQHPTQKPVALYKWLLSNYAKDGDSILDTHLGSGSIAIACHDMGFDLTGYELDADYYAAAGARLDKHRSQGQFDF
jgi:site-specific DNA-methyltransferase (adenine-specific)